MPLAPTRQVSRRDALVFPAEELGQRVGRVPLRFAREEIKRGEHRLSFLEAQVDLTAEATMPPERGPWIAGRFPISKEQAELESFTRAAVLELRGG
jgi:hypothetical protein